MVPEGTKTMGSYTPGPEDSKKQDNGSRYLATTTHSLKTIRVGTCLHEVQQMAETAGRRCPCPPNPRVLGGLSDACTSLDGVPILLTLR